MPASGGCDSRSSRMSVRSTLASRIGAGSSSDARAAVRVTSCSVVWSTATPRSARSSRAHNGSSSRSARTTTARASRPATRAPRRLEGILEHGAHERPRILTARHGLPGDAGRSQPLEEIDRRQRGKRAERVQPPAPQRLQQIAQAAACAIGDSARRPGSAPDDSCVPIRECGAPVAAARRRQPATVRSTRPRHTSAASIDNGNGASAAATSPAATARHVTRSSSARRGIGERQEHGGGARRRQRHGDRQRPLARQAAERRAHRVGIAHQTVEPAHVDEITLGRHDLEARREILRQRDEIARRFPDDGDKDRPARAVT